MGDAHFMIMVLEVCACYLFKIVLQGNIEPNSTRHGPSNMHNDSTLWSSDAVEYITRNY